MTIEDIFSTMASHMVKGLMVHSQLADYYYFLNLEGYAECHKYHFLKESQAYRDTMKYYIERHHKILTEYPIDIPEVIPSSWRKYSTMDIDGATVKTAVRDGLNTWIKWETETKELYEDLYKELLDMSAICDTIFMREMISDVCKELDKAKQYKVNKEFIGYDIVTIVSEQKSKVEKYREKCKNL